MIKKLLMVFSITICLYAAEETIYFSGSYGADDSCGSGYKTTSDNRICVANNMLIYDDEPYVGGNAPQTLSFKVDGVNLSSFNLKDINIYAAGSETKFEGDGTSSQTHIKFFDSNNNVISIQTLNGQIDLAGTKYQGLSALLGQFTSVSNIARFDIYLYHSQEIFVDNFTINSLILDTSLAPANDTDASVTASAIVSEPVSLASTVDSTNEAVDLFDFTISDGGTSDGLSTDVSQIVLNVSGTTSNISRSKITWRLNGADANNIQGVYNSSSNTITFSGLNISVADAQSEVYTINGYFNDNTGLSDNETIILSIDGDSDLTLSSSGTQMGSTSAVTNASGTPINITATALSFTTQAARSVSGNNLLTQPVVSAVDAFGNVDTDFAETVSLSEASAGMLLGSSVSAVNGVATFTNLKYTATVDKESFVLTANDEDNVESNLPTTNANAVISDVVATKLIFFTEPSPTSLEIGVNTTFLQAPVVHAVDENNLIDKDFAENITISENGAGTSTFTNASVLAVNGVATFTNLQLNYDTNETFQLIADDEASVGSDFSSVSSTNITVSSNNAPTLTSFSTFIDNINEDTQSKITFSSLKSKSNAADSDGSVDAFVVQEVSTGSLKIGSSEQTATLYVSGVNDTIDSSNSAYWIPEQNANGVLNAFTLKAKDDDGALSTSAVQTQVLVDSINDKPILTLGSNQAVFGTGAVSKSVDNFASMSDDGDLENQNISDFIVTKQSDTNNVITSIDIENNGKLVFTPANNVEGVATINVQVKDDGGVENNGVDTSSVSSFTISVDTKKPTLNSVSISSNNSNTTKAKVGDTVTLSFSVSETLNATPNVKIVNQNASVTKINANDYKATYTMQSNNGEGVVSFTIDFVDSAGNNAVQVTSVSDTSSVIFDKTAPLPNLATIVDDKGSIRGNLIPFATTDDTSLTLNGTNEIGSSVKVYNSNTFLGMASVTGTSWTYEANVVNNTTYKFNIKETDSTGNESVATSDYEITVDTTASSVLITSAKNAAKNGEIVDLTFTLSEESSDFTSDDITVSAGSLSDFTKSASNSKVYTAKLTIDDITTTQATIDINQGVFTNAIGNGNSSAIQKVITIVPSVVKLTPSKNSSDIALNQALSLEFSELVSKGTIGEIKIFKTNGDILLESIDITEDKIIIKNPSNENSLTKTTVSINKATSFELNTNYYVSISSSAFKDADGNFYEGISNKTTWNFTTINNQAPSITNNSSQDSATINVNENQTALIDIEATDPDIGQNLSYFIEGDDANLFDIDSSSGVITFKTAPNYEVKSSYSIVAKVSDGILNDTQTLNININDVNDNPVINISSFLSLDEDKSKDLIFTYTDEDSNTVSAIEKTAPNNGTISINASTITYTPNANYNGSDLFVLTFSDSNGFTTDKTVNVTINAVDDKPEITTNFENQIQKEDGKGFVLDLASSDLDSDISSAFYTVTSSNEDIAIAYIKNAKLIVVPQKNANGQSIISVSVTNAGLTSLVKSFIYTLSSVNDAPRVSNISDISLKESSEDIQKTIQFDIWDDDKISSLEVTSSNTSLISNISVSKISETLGSLTYTVSKNSAGSSLVTLLAKDSENLEFKESFYINVKASNEALCVENTKTALTFNMIKLNNTSQDMITQDLDFINTISSVCDSSISWSSSDENIINQSGTVNASSDNKTVKITANIAKDNFTTSKDFLVTVVGTSISDEEAIKKLLFNDIKNQNSLKNKITSKLDLIDTLLNKDITWSSSNEDVITSYSGYVTRGSSNENVTLTANIGTASKTFDLVVLKEETSSKDCVDADFALLTINSLLHKNKSANDIKYNLVKPLPSLGANGSTISWESSNSNHISTNADVIRDENSDKFVTLIATITNNDVSSKKEFNFRVLQNSIENSKTSEFKNASTSNNEIEVTTIKDGQDVKTKTTLSNTIANLAEKVISQESVKTVIELTSSLINSFLNTDGSVTNTLQNQSGISSSLDVKDSGANTVIDENGNITTTKDGFAMKLNNDGSVEHTILNSVVNSTIEGTNTKYENNSMETTAFVKQNNSLYKAVVTTNNQGEATTKFVRVDLSTGEESDISPTLNSGSFPNNNNIKVEKIDGVLYIEVKTPLDETLVIK